MRSLFVYLVSLSIRLETDTLGEHEPRGLHESQDLTRWTLNGDPSDVQQIILLIRSHEDEAREQK